MTDTTSGPGDSAATSATRTMAMLNRSSHRPPDKACSTGSWSTLFVSQSRLPTVEKAAMALLL